MDEVIGFLLGTKNKTGWFTTKEYVDFVAVQGIVDQVMDVRFSITDGELYVEDVSEELTESVFSDRFTIANGYLTFEPVV